ncbi:uncharacterized protein LOC113465819 [Diaphorina citri]|uniref:Uncharacterized protein LOC113465819 n=1 Tax=Diaphorina citri TaxID=121845 RepID=A0A3Q0IP94_DIACI|nr:uncharacterized protein LOC113465819 [Diaphorina citri]
MRYKKSRVYASNISLKFFQDLCEFERLLHEYRQNQLLISNIDHFYQIIYPVQLKNHEKMGISTREVASKYPNRGSHDNYQSSLGTKGRSREFTAFVLLRVHCLISYFHF